MTKNFTNNTIKSVWREKLDFAVNPDERKVTILGDIPGNRVIVIDLFEKKKELNVGNCLMYDDSSDDDDDDLQPVDLFCRTSNKNRPAIQLRVSARTPKPNSKYDV